MAIELFVCAGCGGIFETTRSEAEAEVEFRRVFGDSSLPERLMFCERCYGIFMSMVVN